MKILFVCHRLPYPPNRGGKIRPFNMIKHLSRRHSVVVVTLAHSKRELLHGADLKNYCEEVICEVVPNSIRWGRAVMSLFSSTPSSVSYFRSSRLYRRVRERLMSSSFDAILVHCAFVAQYVADWSGSCRVLDYGDLDSAKWAEYAKWKRFPLSLGYELEARKLRRYERELAHRFHRCTVTTIGERNEFEELATSVPCTIIPNGVDTDYFSSKQVTKDVGPIIVFLGRMDYFLNVDGVCSFIEKVFPLIRAKVPNVILRVIGSAPSRRIQQWAATPGILVTGHVPDIRHYLQDAAVSIAPLRIARGTQNKILESMAMGIPVVATSKAAKGISAVPGRDLIVPDEPEAFAREVVRLLEDPDLRQTLSRAGRRQVESAHQWSKSMSMLDGLTAAVACVGSGK